MIRPNSLKLQVLLKFSESRAVIGNMQVQLVFYIKQIVHCFSISMAFFVEIFKNKTRKITTLLADPCYWN